MLPPTPQRLVLISTAPGRNSREGTARIGTDPEHPQTYVAGASIANGARLGEVHAKYVVLERDGKTFELHISGTRSDRGDAALAMVGGPPPAAPAKVTMADDRLSGVIRSMPVYDGIALVGLQVFPGPRSGLFNQLGLRSGDVVVALDGAPLAEADEALTILRSLADGASMTATVRRGGATTTIGLDGALLAAADGASMASFTGAMSQ